MDQPRGPWRLYPRRLYPRRNPAAVIGRLLLAAGLVAWAATVFAAGSRVAVATNFAAPMKWLVADFEARADYRIVPSFASTGTLYAQIVNGAPFAVFLAADRERPERLVAQGLAVAQSRFTYARGRLALWAGESGLDPSGGAILRSGAFRRLAIANPATAPYGAAAQALLERIGRWKALQGRVVRGANIAQTYQFVATGNAELGLVAWSQLRAGPAGADSATWLVPAELHPPIEQQAVLLTRFRNDPAARAFLAYLRSAPAREAIGAFGYE